MRIPNETLALLGSLGLSPKPGDYPHTVITLAQIIADLQARLEKLEQRSK